MEWSSSGDRPGGDVMKAKNYISKLEVAARPGAAIALRVAFTALLFSGWTLGEPTYPPFGPVPEIGAVEAGGPDEPSYTPPAQNEVGPDPTAIPPLGLIPPAPMPNPDDNGPLPRLPSGPGKSITYNPDTGEESQGQLAPETPADASGQGGYYAGSDGGAGLGELGPASFAAKTKITALTSSPWRMNVKVAFRRGSSWYVCSGAMRDARTVQTAGHCVHQGSGGAWNDETWVFPAWDGVGDYSDSGDEYRLQKWGGARGSALGSWTGWTASGNFDYDWGIVELDRAVGFLTGWYGWQYGTNCPTTPYHVAAYPAESCPTAGLHNGRDMYYWNGTIDSCPGNQLRINTTAGCMTALYGGESGSNLYYWDGSDGRFVRGIASTSNRSTVGQYVNLLQSWVDYINNTFLPTYGRGPTFDLEALDMNVSPTTLRAGGSGTTTLNHLAANGTNGTKNAQFNMQVRLSPNDLISTGDTNLSNQSINWNFGSIGSVRVNNSGVSIPENTPPGTYWLGVTYDASSDTNSSNNDSSYWDAVQITVTQETNPPSPGTMLFSTNPYALSETQIQMVAASATDPSGGIQYYFDFTSSPTGGPGGGDSGWQSSRTYTDAGLLSNHQYCYRVRARDTYGNVNTYSAIRCALTPNNTDTDGDGVPDTSDNCTLEPNPTQCDADADGFGNHCDADLNNDGRVNGLDLGPFKLAFGTTNAVADLNCDGRVNGLDLGPFKKGFGKPPGPSGPLP